MPHLFVDVSSHGFGHFAQTAPVLNALAERLPGLRISLRSGLPRPLLAARLGLPFTHLPAASDFGFAMRDAMRIDRAATAARYRQVHAGWAAAVAANQALLAALHPDFVLSNVSYLPLAAAAGMGLPSAAMCSLNWADLLAEVFAGEDWLPPVRGDLHAAYANADFLALTPAMAMPTLPRVTPMPPVATPALDGVRAAGLRERLDVATDERLVLVAFGGIPTRLPVERWAANSPAAPAAPRIRWLCPAAWSVQHPQVAPIEATGLDFSTLLGVCDAIVTKPGYGTFVEAAVNAAPVLYLRRDEWPEQDCLIEWLQRVGTARELDPDELAAGRVGESLLRLWEQERRPPVRADGADAVADWLAARLA